MDESTPIQILGSDDIARAIRRISHEIIENNPEISNTLILGIPTRGVSLANRLVKTLHEIGTPVESGVLDITLFRDDLTLREPKEITPTQIPISGIDGRNIILVDDVLYSGRTIRAALDAIRTHGRPKRVQLAVLVDRGHRELPIRADYVGKNIPTASSERIKVSFMENDGVDSVSLYKNKLEVSK